MNNAEQLRPYIPEPWIGANGERFTAFLIPRENYGNMLALQVFSPYDHQTWRAEVQIDDDLTLIRPVNAEQFVLGILKNMEHQYYNRYKQETRLEEAKRRRRNYHAQVLDK